MSENFNKCLSNKSIYKSNTNAREMHAVGLTLSAGYQNIEQPNIAIMGILISLKLFCQDWLQVLFVASV